MKKLLQEPFTYVIVYIAMFIFTYGHAFNRYPASYDTTVIGKTVTIQTTTGEAAVGALMQSMFWPLYWSVQVQK